MHLLKLTHSDVYRDGGSLEGTWTTSEGNDWTICLAVEQWKNLKTEHKSYKLYTCKRNHTGDNKPIIKGSDQDKNIIHLIDKWLTDNNLNLADLKDKKFGRAFELIEALQWGNY